MVDCSKEVEDFIDIFDFLFLFFEVRDTPNVFVLEKMLGNHATPCRLKQGEFYFILRMLEMYCFSSLYRRIPAIVPRHGSSMASADCAFSSNAKDPRCRKCDAQLLLVNLD